MPVVTSSRVGSFVGTVVAAREKLRMPAAASATPMRIRQPPTVQRIRSPLGTANTKGSRRSAPSPSRRAPRKRRGGRAMTPAVPLSFTCCPAGSLHMNAPADAGGLRGRNSLLKTTTWVSFCKLTTAVSTGETGTAKGNGGDDVGTTQDRGGPEDRGGPNRRQQGRGDRRADARSGPVLLQDTGRRPEDRAHHQLGRRCVRLHAKPRAAWSADRAADSPDAAHQPPADAAAGG